MPKQEIVQNYEITKVELKNSKFRDNPIFYYVFFKGQTDGKGYRMPVYPKARNYSRWASSINFENLENNPGLVFTGLRVFNIKKGILDADSLATVIEKRA